MVRLSVLCPADIAIRRFLPALKKVNGIEFAGIGVASREERFGSKAVTEATVREVLGKQRQKAEAVIQEYGGRIFSSYEEAILSEEADAVYIPLPPALHFLYALKALQHGKHVLVEKPCTLNLKDTSALILEAEKNDLALHENYMFVYHRQLQEIKEIIKDGRIGDVRLYRADFGFPRRAASDFRYQKDMGGGALIDAGGYCIRLGSELLGKDAHIAYAQKNGMPGMEVDMYGSGAMVGSDGTVLQFSYGMDNAYRCDLEVWGSEGILRTGRILTAPVGYVPSLKIQKQNNVETIVLSEDDAFCHSIEYFRDCIENKDLRTNRYKEVLQQAQLLEEYEKMSS